MMMAVSALWLMFFLAFAGHSSAAMYCLCRDGASEAQLQKNIDFACGSGADCSAILQNGACYNPNTVKDHCNYAVNSYYQRQSQSGADCNFSGTAGLSPNPPASLPGSCVYQSTPGNTGGGNSGGSGTGGTVINNNTPPFGLAPGSTMNPDGSSRAARDKHTMHFTLAFMFSCMLLICLRV